jgi:hypothetical protein
MKKHGCVLVFNPEMSREECEHALRQIEGLSINGKEVVDTDYYIGQRPTVEEFESDHGGPVWYVP